MTIITIDNINRKLRNRNTILNMGLHGVAYLHLFTRMMFIWPQLIVIIIFLHKYSYLLNMAD